MEQLIEATREIGSARSHDEARQKCRRLLAWAFDVPAMAQYALGAAWDKARAAERRAFSVAFEDLIVAKYVRQARQHRDESMSFSGARPDDDKHWLAATQRNEPGRPEVVLVWRLRKSGQSWRVVDLMTDGGSVLLRERQEYARILEESHGNLNFVIQFIRQRAEN